MTAYRDESKSMSWDIHEGDVLAVLKSMPSNFVDACFCDPPYGLKFLGKKWDHGVPSAEVWAELLRVLKPGAPLMAFGGTRTFHRLFCAIEGGGFQIRDTLAWVYGPGIPKSLDLSKAIDKSGGHARPVTGTRTLQGNAAMSTAEKGGTYAVGTSSAGRTKVIPTTGPSEHSRDWDGYGTALIPSWEPVCLAMKPLDGTYVENLQRWGVAGLAIDASRIPRGEEDRRSWPPNAIFDEAAGEALDAQSGQSSSTTPGFFTRRSLGGAVNYAARNEVECLVGYGDKGGASRFYYCPKVSRFEREFGCEALPMKSVRETVGREKDSPGAKSARAGASRSGGARNLHPTLKPIDLARYLARMMLPPPREGSPRRILVPFSGAGSEMIGCLRAGWDYVEGIELEPEYIAIARARIARWEQVPADFDVEDIERVKVDDRQMALWSSCR